VRTIPYLCKKLEGKPHVGFLSLYNLSNFFVNLNYSKVYFFKKEYIKDKFSFHLAESLKQIALDVLG
jgi:hypothetical protein